MTKNFPGELSPWKGFAMERRFELRKRQLLDDAELKSELSKGMLGRLETFVEPFAVTLRRREMKENAQQYVGGLLSDLERKNVESIAYRCDRDRRAFQRFIGIAPWDFRPLEKELVCRVSQSLATPMSTVLPVSVLLLFYSVNPCCRFFVQFQWSR